MNDSQRQERPTTWIVIAAVCALAAIGFAIWGFTTKSDLDDAEATIDRQQQQLAAQTEGAAQEESRLAAFGRREREAYRAVRRRLVRERAVAGDLEKKVKTEAGELETARQEVASADSQDKKEAARLKQARAATRLAVACSASAVDALNRFFDSASPRAGAAKAVKQLENTQQECATAASEDQ
jgi:cell division protein FtsL